MAVFEVDAAIFDSDHGADVAGLGVLDHHADLDRMLNRSRRAPPSPGQDVAAISIRHAAILGSRSPDAVAARRGRIAKMPVSERL
ncbi:hypothetical protein BZL30_4608 [Mycobacterium kansasii]|uniref:Uncharacterized protein n=1 Tax=Mycobacterium kansasii TaxID=1768 RepID=A0A1V3X3L9_MYCKA|nr:hypothetical protein BZL30_4608 [Mycobacterium kansasii]